MHVLRAVVAALTLTGVVTAAQQAPPPSGPPAQPPSTGSQQPASPQQPPAPTAPGAPSVVSPAAVPAPTAAPGCPAPVPPATPPARAFGSQTGMLLHPVQSTRVADFELFLRYVRDALAKSTSATVRSQARGWKFFRVAEPGPNGDVIYAFLLDPAVPCVDYALAPILAEAYPDPAQMQEIWKLYTGSVRSGGTVMNLIPLPEMPPPPAPTPAAADPAAAAQSPEAAGAPGADPAAKPAPPPAPSPQPPVPAGR